jgi:hypothetical protein
MPMTTRKFNYKRFATQEQLLETIHNEEKQWFLFATDKNKNSGQKMFSSIDIDDVWKIEILLGGDKHMYEWIPDNLNIKPYFDCEMEGTEFTKEESFIRIQLFINFVCREMNLFFQTNLTEKSFIILDSCRANKLSYHLIVKDTFYFECTKDHKNFIMWLNDKFDSLDDSERNLLSWSKTDKAQHTHPMTIFDNLVYSSNQKIRCINQSKMGKYHVNEKGENMLDNNGKPIPITLVNSTIPLLETLIGLYKGVGDRKKINELSLNYDLKETVKSKKTKNKINIIKTKNFTEYNYALNGETLMERKKLKYEDLTNFPDYKQCLFLIPNTNQNYHFYSKMAYMLFLLGADVSLFVEWAELYHSYDKNCPTIKNFSKQRNNPDFYPINFMRKYAKMSHPEFFKIEQRLLLDYYNPFLDSMQIITESSNYVSEEGTPDEKNIENKAKIILIQADLGAGKTTAITRVIKKYNNILIISPRIAYAEHVVKEFGVKSYLEGNYEENLLACSVESLYKIPDSRFYDCVILDECEAILSIFSSPTLKNRQLDTYSKLKTIIEKSQKVFFAGAFITQKTIDFIQSFNMSSILIKNLRISARKQAIEIPPENFNSQLITYIAGGGKPYVYWDSKTKADFFISELRGFCMNNELMKKKMDKMIFYNSDSDDIIFKGLSDINDVWDSASFVMATPSITVGNSYCPQNTTFSSVWILGFPTCIVADTIQGHKRVRHTTTNKLYFCVPPESTLKFLSGMRGNMIHSLAQFDNITDEKRELIVSSTQKRIEKINNNKHHDESTEQYDAIVRALTNEYVQTPTPLRQLLFQNALENELSHKFVASMFSHYIDICGYDIISSRKKDGTFKITKEEEKQNTLNRINRKEEVVQYINIEAIDIELKEIIQQKINNKTATRHEKLQVYKFYFDLTIDSTLSPEHKQNYFKAYMDNKSRRILGNLYKESNSFTEVNFLKDYQAKNIMTAENIRYESLKLPYIKTITKQLGLLSTTDISNFTRKIVENMGNYLFTERSNIHKIFKLRDQCTQCTNPTNSVADSLDLLRKNFHSWHGGTIKSSDKCGNFYIFSLYSHPPPYKINIDNEDKIVRHLEPLLIRAINENATNEPTNCMHEIIEIEGRQKSPQIKIPLKHKTIRNLTFTPVYA